LRRAIRAIQQAQGGCVFGLFGQVVGHDFDDRLGSVFLTPGVIAGSRVVAKA
jgi:hypothetical protein